MVFRAVLAWFVLTLGAILVLRFIDPPTTAFMLERRFEARNDKKRWVLKQQWAPFSVISPALARAVIAAEDQKFASHHGFDFNQIVGALDDRLEHKRRNR